MKKTRSIFKKPIIKTHYIKGPYGDQYRRIRVLLPPGFDRRQGQRYPVVYLHDGQNLFFDEESYSGRSWGLISLQRRKSTPGLIFVGIDNLGEERLDEYAPWELDEEPRGGWGDIYADWLVGQVKPLIDRLYPTLTGPEHSLLAGSSLGGLISAYMGSKYPQVFGSLGIFSLASWVSEGAFLDYVENNPLSPTTRVYMMVGTQEGAQEEELYSGQDLSRVYIKSSLNYYEFLLDQGHSPDNLCLRIINGGSHNEDFWARHFGEFIAHSFNE